MAQTHENMPPTRPTRARDPQDLADSLLLNAKYYFIIIIVVNLIVIITTFILYKGNWFLEAIFTILNYK